MKKIATFLLVALLLAVGAAPTLAATVTATAPGQGKDAMVGGLPLFVTFSATTDSSEGATTIVLPAGFVADYVKVIDDYDAATSLYCEWHKGMPAASAVVTAGASTAPTGSYITSNGITVAAGSIVIGTGCQVNSGNVLGFAVRFSE